MKKISSLFFYALLPFTLVFYGCPADIDDDVMPSLSEAIILDCRIDGNLNLTDHNPNGVDYVADCDIEIRGNVSIAPGTTIQINDDYHIEVISEGSLSATGTAVAPIVFQGQNGGTEATWAYLAINTTNASNKLDHVIIENAGNNTGWNANVPEKSAIYLEGRLAMTNTSISGSNGSGLLIAENILDANLTQFASNVIRNCNEYPITTTPNQIESMDLPSCTFSGNSQEFIYIYDDNGADRLTVTSSWENAPIPYFIDFNLELYSSLTIEAGSEIIFGSGAGLAAVSSQETFLKVNGTEANHVIMRGQVATSGAWLGLYIPTSNAQNEFNYLDISDGGQETLSFSDFKGNITLDFEQPRLTLNNCTSTRSECDVVIATDFSQDYNFTNNSPSIVNVCVD